MVGTVQRPDFQVVLRVFDSEVAVLAGFRTKEESVDIIVGVDDRGERDAYALIIEQCALALRSADNWRALPHADSGEVPF